MLNTTLQTSPNKTTCRFGFELMPGDGFAGFSWGTQESELRDRLGAPMLESSPPEESALAYPGWSDFGSKEVVKWYVFDTHGLSEGSYVCEDIAPHEFEECINYIARQLSAEYGDMVLPVSPMSATSAGWYAGGDTEIQLSGELVAPGSALARVEVHFRKASWVGTDSPPNEPFRPQDSREAAVVAQIILGQPHFDDPDGFAGCPWGSSPGQVAELLGDPPSRSPWPGKPEREIYSYPASTQGAPSLTNLIFEHGGLSKGAYMMMGLSREKGWLLVHELRRKLVPIFGDGVVHRRQEDPMHPQGEWYGFMWRTDELSIMLQIKAPVGDCPEHAVQLDFAPLSMIG